MMGRFLRTVLALLLVGVLGAGWYFYKRGLTREWREFVSGEFRKRGVELSLRQLALVPFRGFVARGVKIYDGAERKRTLAAIDEMVLVIDYAGLLQGQPFLQALDLRRARLSVVFDKRRVRNRSGGGVVEVGGLSGRLLLTPQKLVLSYLEANVHGVQVSASGRLLHPQALKLSDASEEGGDWLGRVGDVMTHLRRMKFEGPVPRLDVSFSGDLERPEQMEGVARLRSGVVRYGGATLQSVRVALGLKSRTLEVEELEIKDGHGRLEGSGLWALEDGEGSMRVRSSMDLLGLARALKMEVSGLNDLALSGRARVDLEGRWGSGGVAGLSFQGRIETDRLAVRSVGFEGLQADFSYNHGSWSVRGLSLAHRTGVLRAEMVRQPGQFRAKVNSRLRPEIFASLLGGRAGELLGQLEFTEPPQLNLEVEGVAPDWDAVRVSGGLECGRGSFRKVGVEGLKVPLEYRDRVLKLGPFHLKRSEGEASGEVEVDMPGQVVRLKGLRTRVHPAEVLVWVDRNIAKAAEPYRFVRQPPSVSLDGVVDLKSGGAATRISLDVDAPAGMDYTFLNRKLSSPKVSGKLFFTSRDLKISGLDAVLFGGHVKGDATISIVLKQPGHSARIQMERVDFSSLTKLYFGYDDSKGVLDGTYSFTGIGDDARTMRGDGRLRVSEGNVFAIPFLGPFSGILNGIVPGMGLDVARSAETAFRVEKGIISTDALQVLGNGFTMQGRGKLFFLDDGIDFTMRVNAKGIPGVLLFPVSKLLEYVSDERLSKPQWRPRAIPKLGGG